MISVEIVDRCGSKRTATTSAESRGVERCGPGGNRPHGNGSPTRASRQRTRRLGVPPPGPGTRPDHQLWVSRRRTSGQEEGVKGRPCAIILTMRAASRGDDRYCTPNHAQRAGGGSEQRTGCEPPEGRHFQRLAPTAQCPSDPAPRGRGRAGDDGADEPFGHRNAQTRPMRIVSAIAMIARAKIMRPSAGRVRSSATRAVMASSR